MHFQVPNTQAPLAAFNAEMDRIRVTAMGSVGPADLAHLVRMSRLGNGLLLVGAATAWIAPNPISVGCLALGLSLRWTVAHHVMHGAYERIPGVPARFTRRHFARGRRRFIDWLDWIEPEAWLYEHNALHHAHTNEPRDPDLVHRNFEWLRRSRAPRLLKAVVLLFIASAWKLVYYAPNALNGLAARGRRRELTTHRYELNPANALDPRNPLAVRFWRQSVAPYVLVQFALPSLLLLPFGAGASLAFIANRVAAEVLTNLHSFIVIVPSHAGDDLAKYTGSVSGREDYYVRQIAATTNYRTGGVVNDLLHMWINYQIEHHCFPALPMSAYPRVQPEVEDACRRHDVRYSQDSVFARLRVLIRSCIETSTHAEVDASETTVLPLQSGV